MKPHSANFRFYEELNDFLAPGDRKRDIVYRFDGSPAVKDSIETLGVPHTEVDLILANQHSVGFEYRLRHGDRVAVYPVFESLDISSLQKLRPAPLRRTAFVVDVNLGKLARRLRMLGFDTVYGNRLEDQTIAEIACREHRIVLTRDRRLLFRKRVSHGYWVRAQDPDTQLLEVIERFDLQRQVRPLRRCLDCNGDIERVEPEQVWAELEPLTRRHYREFFRCTRCRKVYWEGSHVEQMHRAIQRLTTT